MTAHRMPWCATPGQRSAVIGALASFSFAKAEVMELVPEHTSRALNREFEDKLAMTVMRRIFSKLFLPAPITTAMALYRSVKYIREGLTALWHGELTVAVLDATAVTVSMVRGDFSTAGSVMFMLRLGEILGGVDPQEVCADLAGAMSLNGGQGMCKAAIRRYWFPSVTCSWATGYWSAPAALSRWTVRWSAARPW